MESHPNVSFDDTQVAFSYKSDKELRNANFIFSTVNNPLVSSLATNAMKLSLKLRLPVKTIIRNTVFEHFCGGESIEEAESTIQQLAQYGVGTILDYSVEGAKTEAGFNHTAQEIIWTLEKSRNRPEIPFCVFKMSGVASVELLEKIQQGQNLTSEEEEAFEKIKVRVNRICSKAYEYDIPLLIDAEETWVQDVIDKLVFEMMEKYNKEGAIIFNTYQLYRTDALKNLREAFHNAAMHNYFLGVKLVRGAYMEKERERAIQHGHASPIFPDKDGTDEAFNKALSFCISNKQRISMMCGSHNEYSNYYLTVLMDKHGLQPNDRRVWFAQLYGMSDNISFNLAQAGYNVAKYVPYGPVESVMPYLFRRAEENTSVAGQSSRELLLIRKELDRRRRDRDHTRGRST